MAQSISPSEFSSRFPLKGAERELTDIHYGDLQLDRNSAITGIVHGNVVVPANLSAEIMGRVHGSVTIESQGVAYISGVVDGAVRVDGAALITGIVEGALQASENAVIAVTGFVGAR